MTQLDIFAAPVPTFPRARRADARSSHDAAELVERKGIAKAQAEAVLAALKRWPMSTSMELAKSSGIDRYAIARRLPELCATGQVQRIEPEVYTLPCAVSGKRVIRWRAR